MSKQFIVRGDIPKEPALIIKNQPIVTPGEYYGINLSEHDIREHIRLTNWSDPYNSALIFGHKTNTNDEWLGNPSPEDWVGNYTVPEFKSIGVPKPGAYSDINIYDSDLAAKLAYGNVKCGVSVALDLQHKGFKNLSIIDNPACKLAFLNLSKDENGIPTMEPTFLNLSEHARRIMNLEDKESPKTSTDEGHYHEFIINPQTSNGMTTNTIGVESVHPDHIHDILSGEVQMAEGHTHSIRELLNLADDTNIDERRLNDVNMENDMKEKFDAVEKRLSELETPKVEVKTDSVDEPKPKEEPIVKDELKDDVKDDKIEDKKPKEPKPTEPTQPAPVIIENKTSDNTEVVDAIKEMGDKFSEEVKKVANPQSVAPTDPNAAEKSNMDDEVTDNLVEQYNTLHPEIKKNE